MFVKEKKSYDIFKYQFKEELEKIFNIADLSDIHKEQKCDFDTLTFETDQSTNFHKIFYDKIQECNFLTIYKSFIEEVILPQFQQDILYQKIPTFRIQVPNNISVAEFHKDKTYSHSPYEVNIFLPITYAKDTYTVWSESIEDLGDYAPMEANYGEYYLWDGANLNHGSKINTHDLTRISVDFRILPYKDYNEDDVKKTVNTKTQLKLGSYFNLIEYKTKSY
tara:strand:+ start:7636 stop:8301 length:666 start_codon:yes stop_codon:yes gene_type:complete